MDKKINVVLNNKTFERELIEKYIKKREKYFQIKKDTRINNKNFNCEKYSGKNEEIKEIKNLIILQNSSSLNEKNYKVKNSSFDTFKNTKKEKYDKYITKRIFSFKNYDSVCILKTESTNGTILTNSLKRSIVCDYKTIKEIDYTDDLYIIWGIIRGSDLIIKNKKKFNYSYINFDHSYTDMDRGHDKEDPVYRVSLNETQNLIKFDCDNSRLKLFNFYEKPWRKTGKHILICPPSESVSNIYDLENWEQNIITELRKYTDRPIKIRRKDVNFTLNKTEYGAYPVPNKNSNKNGKEVPLEYDLKNCWCLVTFNSTVAVKALMEGIPVFCSDKCIVSLFSYNLDELSKVENLYPKYDNREELFRLISFSQWRVSEILKGLPFEFMKL